MGSASKELALGFICQEDAEFTFGGDGGSTETAGVGLSDMGFCADQVRGVFEFAISAIGSGQTIQSAELTLSQTVSSLIDVHGFWGDGSLDTADGNVDNKIAEGDGNTSSIDLTSFLVSAYANQASYVGIMLDIPLADNTSELYFDFGSAAKLTIEYDRVSAVPLPASGLLLAAGIIGFVGLRRRKLN